MFTLLYTFIPQVSLDTMAAKKRLEINLEQRISMLKDYERLSKRQPSAVYWISQTTVSNVSKGKSESMDAYKVIHLMIGRDPL